MEPKVQYATTTDNVSLAYWAMGEGLPLVCPPPAMPWSHIQLEWQITEWRHWYEHLMRHCEVVRYDGRGAGLSDREVDDMGLEADIRDLEAVIDAAGFDKVALFGLYYSGPVAIAYAARHPERVSHLILWCTFADAGDARRPQAMQEALERLREVDWNLFTETLAHSLFGWSEGDPAHRVAEYMQASLTPDMARRSWDAHVDYDVTHLLKDVACPTLVIHRRQLPVLDIAISRSLAAGIPGAKLTVLDGSSLSPYVGDMEPTLAALDEFLGGDGKMIRDAQHLRGESGGFRTIMFTDMEGSTETTQRLGDAEAQSLVRAHNQIVRDALHSFSGTEVKHTGDGIMASFTSATLAVECAIGIQRGLASHSAMHPKHPMFNVRIGLNAGEPVIEGNDLFGTAVQLASRVCARADARQILVSDVVRQLVAGKGFLFSDRGETELRGFEETVRLFEVHWREAGS
ncbi:MAG TPA: adenylate/guanylate cyclase domain-containing protein [Dehalococcoidia bacterium]